MSASRKIKSLDYVSKHGGTPNEREVAKKLADQLKSNLLPAKREESQDDQWNGQGVLCRHRGVAKAYVYGRALKHFLSEVEEGKYFTVRSIRQLDQVFGSGDFYLILSFLSFSGLIHKEGSKYKILSKRDIVTAWNREIDKMKL